MKRYLIILLVLLFALSLTACKKEEIPEEFSFRATVLEVHQTYLLVEPAEDAWERNSASKITLSLQEKTSWPTPQAGDTVDVFYNGEILETYPAHIGKLYRVEIVS